MEFPILTTERLILRDILPADAADVLVFRGDPIVQKYDDPPIHTLQESLDFIAEMRRYNAEQKQQMWVVTVKGRTTVIGLVTLHFMHPGDCYHRRAEIGYGLAHATWGQGFGSESVRAVVHYGFEDAAVVGLNDIPHQSIVPRQRLLHRFRVGFPQAGAALDVRKHKTCRDHFQC